MKQPTNKKRAKLFALSPAEATAEVRAKLRLCAMAKACNVSALESVHRVGSVYARSKVFVLVKTPNVQRIPAELERIAHEARGYRVVFC